MCAELDTDSVFVSEEITRPVRAAFSCFYGSQIHPTACRHALYDLLTLASNHYRIINFSFILCQMVEIGDTIWHNY